MLKNQKRMIGDELLIFIPLKCVCRQFVLVHDFVSVLVGIDKLVKGCLLGLIWPFS